MDYTTLASKETVEKTIAALKERNVVAELVPTKADALARITTLIPAGASVTSGASRTLDEIGFTDLMKSGEHQWNNLKAAIVAEKDPAMQVRLRRESTLADYYLGSVHALAENGEMLIASNTASQLPSIVYSSPNVILVVSTIKIVPDLESAMKRLREHVIPLEDARMKSVGAPGTMLGKLVIFEKESPYNGRTVRVLFVNEPLGF